MTDALTPELGRLVGPRDVLAGEERYERDVTGRFGGAAAAVVRPGSTAEVSAVLAACSEAGATVVPQGGNTGLVGGGVPRGGEVVLSLARLTEVGPLDPVARQVTVGAGVTPAALSAALRGSGLALGVDFGARDAATIGGMAATDAGGAQVLRHGTMRARVAGLEAVLADGRVLRRLSGLVKDNAGYDLPQLLVGSEGTLAVITAVRLQLVAAPVRPVTILLGAASVGTAVDLVSGARTTVPGLLAAELFDAPGMALVREHLRLPHPLAAEHPIYVLLEADGELEALAEAVGDADDVAVADDTARRAALWRYREGLNPAVNAAGVPHKLDISVSLAAMAPFAEAARAAVEGLGGRAILWGHAGDGNLHVNALGLEPDDERVDEAVLGLVASHGGSISAEHGVGVAKRRFLGLTRTPEELAAMTAVKRALDPAGVLNPGVIL
ncbi:MAG TPA: FAD-binding oxidoreductase [Solirubrobacteraceae bacterium]|nr:FAD-binding oxidoreductase [Solirubrobacteraceae bacterium]